MSVVFIDLKNIMRLQTSLFIIAFFFSCYSGPVNLKANVNISVSPKKLAFKANKSTGYATVNFSHAVSLVSSKPWVHAKYVKKNSTDNLIITVNKNTKESYREANILVKSGGSVKKIKIYQEGKLFPKDAKGTHLKVASYNLRYNASQDVKTGNGWNKRKIPMAKLIRTQGWEIFGTLEGDFRQMNDLMELLPEYDYVGNPYGGSSGHLHTASIVYLKSKFKVLDKGEFWYSKTPDKKSIGWDATDLRICTWAKMKYEPTGQQFYFFVSHFYWRYHTAKRHSGKVMVQEINKITDQSDLPVISVGDLNSNPSSPQIADIKELLKSSYEETRIPPSGPKNTNLGGGNFKGPPKNRIDYIFVNNKVRVLSYSSINYKYNGGRHPADHLPIVCNLFLKE